MSKQPSSRRSTKSNEALKAQVLWLKLQVFGQKSQKGKPTPDPELSAAEDGSEADSSTASSPDDSNAPKQKGKRGKKKGAKGHGRHSYDELETEEVIVDLPEGEKRCACCGKPYADFGTEDSQEIDLIFRVIRRI